MSLSVTAMIGALVALLPPAWAQPKDKQSAAQKLARSNARLIDHIQSLERELLTERHLTQTRIEEIENLHRDLSRERALAAHWREEAMRLAREREPLAQYAQQQQALAQQCTLAGMNAFGEGFCNCVPSRAQVWGAQDGLVQRLNDNT